MNMIQNQLILPVLMILFLQIIFIFLFLRKTKQAFGFDEFKKQLDWIQNQIDKLDHSLKADFKTNREEFQNTAKENRNESNQHLQKIQQELNQSILKITEITHQSLYTVNQTLNDKIQNIILQNHDLNKISREELKNTLTFLMIKNTSI